MVPEIDTQGPRSFNSAWWLLVVTALLVARPFLPGVSQASNGQGSVFVVLWLLASVVWFIQRFRMHHVEACVKPAHWNRIDWVLFAFFAWMVLASLVGFWKGNPRAALNSLWQWVAMAVSYGFVRQLFATFRTQNALLHAFIGLAVSMATISLEQYYFSLPASQENYRAVQDSPKKLFELTGEWLPEQSATRQHFENRLFSAEPTATFGLTNSLAGFLVPWLVILAWLIFVSLAKNRNKAGGNRETTAKRKTSKTKKNPPNEQARFGRFFWQLLFLEGLLLFSLVLTKSRSAILAASVGLLLVAFYGMQQLFANKSISKPQRKSLHLALISGLALVSVLVGIGFSTGKLGKHSLSEASRSLGYRLQYWQSSMRMIFDNPLLGCGPGQFQEHYTAYKLPAASEEIADPHNFLVEIAATAGLPAAVLLLVVLWLVSVSVFRKQASEIDTLTDSEETPDKPDANALQSKKQRRHRSNKTKTIKTTTFFFNSSSSSVYAGAALGLILGPIFAWLDGLPGSTLHNTIALAGTLGTIGLLQSRGNKESIPRFVLLIGITSLLIHFLAAGGISDPAQAGTLWVFVAFLSARSTSENKQKACPVVPTWQPLAAAGLCATLLVAAYFTVYIPVMQNRALSYAADDALIRGDAQAVFENLAAATEADPWSSNAARRLASFYFETWKQNPGDDGLLQAWQKAAERATQLAPNSSRIQQENSAAWAEVWRKTSDKKALTNAMAAGIKATQLYPNSAETVASFALLQQEAGNPNDAKELAAKALDLDNAIRKAGHRDKFLPESLRKRLENMLE